jgi:hypothetical protein
MGVSYALSEEAYLTVLLHAAKYPSCTVCGVLLGQSAGGSVTVQTALPMFHLSMLLAPCVDTALTQVGLKGSAHQQACRSVVIKTLLLLVTTVGNP